MREFFNLGKVHAVLEEDTALDDDFHVAENG